MSIREERRSSSESEKEYQFANYDFKQSKKVLPLTPVEAIIVDSDISTDSSIISAQKQIKSPHTISQDGPPEISNSGKTVSENSVYQDDDPTAHYKRLLQEAEQSVSCRDVLIVMLQEQLKKIEDIYKQNLDDTQELRYKYCLTTQELSNLKKICEKYREDIQILMKDKNNIQNEKIKTLQNEVEEWKTQYETLLQQMNDIQIYVTEAAEKISKETQVESDQHDIKIDVEILKNHYHTIQDSLCKQNEKLELLVEKLREDAVLTYNNEKPVEFEVERLSTEKIWMENQDLKKQLDDLKIKNEQICKLNEWFVTSDESSALISDKNSCNSCNTLDELNNILITARNHMEELNEQNDKIHLQISEMSKLKQENEKLYIQLQDAKTEFDFSSVPIDVKDTFVENLNMLNANLKEELSALKDILKTKFNFNECFCENNKDSLVDNDSPNISRGRKGSKVSFIMGYDQIQSLLQKKNPEVSSTFKESQEEEEEADIKNKDVQQLKTEIVDLQRQLIKKDAIINYIQKQANESTIKKNNIFQDLSHQHELLKSDYYEELLKKTHSFPQSLKEKVKQDEIIIHDLEDNIKELNKTLQDREDVNDKNDFIETASQVQQLQVSLAQLKIMFDKAVDENTKYVKEITDYKDQIEKLKEELSQTNQINEQLKSDNESVTFKIKNMANTLKQYKQTAEFKTLENEKLRKKEEQLEHCLACATRNSDYVINEYNKDKEHTNKMLLTITEDNENLKIEYQNKAYKLTQENINLLETVHQQENEIKILESKVDELKTELQNVKCHHEKYKTSQERSLSEFTVLFKNKEDELIQISKKFEKQEEYLRKLEQENKNLKQILDDKKTSLLAQEKYSINVLQQYEYENDGNSLLIDLSKHAENTNQFETSKENYKDEKTKIPDLKNNKDNNTDSMAISTSSMSAILECLETINYIVLQEHPAKPKESTSKGSEETEKYSYCYDEIKSNNKTNKMSNSNIPDLSGVTAKELRIKRKYLVWKVRSAEEKLNKLKNNSLIQKQFSLPKRISSSESDLTCLKAMEKNCCNKDSPKDNIVAKDLFFKCTYYLNMIAQIDQKINTADNTEANENKANGSNVKLENSTYWQQNMKIMKQMACDLNEVKARLKLNKEDISNTLSTKVLQDKDIQTMNEIKNTQEQLTATGEKSEQIDELELQFQLQHARLQELQKKTQNQIGEFKPSTEIPFTAKSESKQKETSKQNKREVENVTVPNAIEEKVLVMEFGQYFLPGNLMQSIETQVRPKELCVKCKDSSSKPEELLGRCKESLPKRGQSPERSKGCIEKTFCKAVSEVYLLEFPANYQKVFHNSEKQQHKDSNNNSVISDLSQKAKPKCVKKVFASEQSQRPEVPNQHQKAGTTDKQNQPLTVKNNSKRKCPCTTKKNASEMNKK